MYNSHRENVWLLCLPWRCLRLPTGGTNRVTAYGAGARFRPTSVPLVRKWDGFSRGSLTCRGMEGNARQGVGAGSVDLYSVYRSGMLFWGGGVCGEGPGAGGYGPYVVNEHDERPEGLRRPQVCYQLRGLTGEFAKGACVCVETTDQISSQVDTTSCCYRCMKLSKQFSSAPLSYFAGNGGRCPSQTRRGPGSRDPHPAPLGKPRGDSVGGGKKRVSMRWMAKAQD